MSYTIFILRFENGNLVDLGHAAFRSVVDSYVVPLEGTYDFLRLRTPDGHEADVCAHPHGTDGQLRSVSISHFGPGQMTDLIVRLAKALDAVIWPPDCPTLLTRPEQREHLPERLAEHVQLVACGADVEAVFAQN